MATTTNFGWETPDDTDLVKDGAAAMRTLGNSIDASFVDLKGGTTGQILSKASNTDLDYTWITNDQGDLTAVTAGVGISITNGTGPVPTITNSSTDLITTAGDILYGTAADTVARLGIGTAGQVLKVNSGATAPEWGSAPSPSYTYTTFTPTIKQGTTAMTGTITGQYVEIGNLVHFVINAAFNSTGASNSAINFSLPVTAASLLSTYTGDSAGEVLLYDTSSSLWYSGTSWLTSTTLGYVGSGVGRNAGSNQNIWGITGSEFAITLASGDELFISGIYRKA